eukprot:GHVR01106038.1.p1 GENE.GHVR01106038.1~~GHVR01106038.1.p1  ORF type:complete len:180 (+),score=58.48 GHVR01106038.1:170-709(+)
MQKEDGAMQKEDGAMQKEDGAMQRGRRCTEKLSLQMQMGRIVDNLSTSGICSKQFLSKQQRGSTTGQYCVRGSTSGQYINTSSQYINRSGQYINRSNTTNIRKPPHTDNRLCCKKSLTYDQYSLTPLTYTATRSPCVVSNEPLFVDGVAVATVKAQAHTHTHTHTHTPAHTCTDPKIAN